MGEMSNIFAGQGGSTIMMVVLIIAMFAVMIIPQRRRDKKVKTMLSALKAGDRIRTIGGFYGTIAEIKDDVLTITCGPDKVRLTIVRSAIANVDTTDVENAETPQA